MKNCAKCFGVLYCAKDCQKADWKLHKKVCAQFAAARASGGGDGGRSSSIYSSRHRTVLDVVVMKPFHELKARTWLHERSEEDMYSNSCRSNRVSNLKHPVLFVWARNTTK
jgi:splicing suppressor protein 51